MQYPNGKKPEKTRENYANKGMNLENDINITNEYYLLKDIAIIHKKPTPVQIVKVDYPARDKAKIVEAYYKTPSTTDYNGIYRSFYIDFECKETTNKTSFPFKNIHLHQYNHLKSVKRHGGIAFLIIFFVQLNEIYLLEIDYIEQIWDSNSAKSISYLNVKENGILINYGFNPRIDYLKGVDKIIDRKLNL
jgi:recombination protein U